MKRILLTALFAVGLVALPGTAAAQLDPVGVGAVTDSTPVQQGDTQTQNTIVGTCQSLNLNDDWLFAFPVGVTAVVDSSDPNHFVSSPSVTPMDAEISDLAAQSNGSGVWWELYAGPFTNTTQGTLTNDDGSPGPDYYEVDASIGFVQKQSDGTVLQKFWISQVVTLTSDGGTTPQCSVTATPPDSCTQCN